jgi:hypothetical protein
MRDDFDFNVLFVSLIENHRCFSDISCAERSNKDIQKHSREKSQMNFQLFVSFILFVYKILCRLQ